MKRTDITKTLEASEAEIIRSCNDQAVISELVVSTEFLTSVF